MTARQMRVRWVGAVKLSNNAASTGLPEPTAICR